ncbi:MAG: hypothetical protein LBV17_02680 [Treponema sp.]|jgi:hypothetical protein|nr:hypothetical protein [Treponema sp.]
MSFFRKNIKFFIFSAVFTAFFTLFVSCSSSKPEISYGFMNLVLYEGETEPVEHFSFFVIADDEDGIENLDELYLYHDKEQLRWKINSGEWVSYTQDNKTWVGSRSITIQEGTLPRGVYRAVLVNKGGERGERLFTYDAGVRHPFPGITIENGMYTIKSEWPSNRLVCYDKAGNYTATVDIQSLSGSVSQLNLPSVVKTVALWADDPAYYLSAFTNVVPVN